MKDRIITQLHSRFNNNKYTTWYINLIEKAILEHDSRINTVHEKHHILPRAIFPEFKKDQYNICLLTCREHFVAHKLLVKMTMNEKDFFRAVNAVCAFLMFRRDDRTTCITSRYVEHIRQLSTKREVSIETRYKMSVSAKKRLDLYGDSNPAKRPEVIEKIRQNRRDTSGPNHHLFGKKRPQEFCDKISEANRRRKYSKETLKKMSDSQRGRAAGEKNPFFGKKHTDNTKQLISKTFLGKKKNRKWMHDNERDVFVRSGEVDEFIRRGYEVGRKHTLSQALKDNHVKRT